MVTLVTLKSLTSSNSEWKDDEVKPKKKKSASETAVDYLLGRFDDDDSFMSDVGSISTSSDDDDDDDYESGSRDYQIHYPVTPPNKSAFCRPSAIKTSPSYTDGHKMYGDDHKNRQHEHDVAMLMLSESSSLSICASGSDLDEERFTHRDNLHLLTTISSASKVNSGSSTKHHKRMLSGGGPTAPSPPPPPPHGLTNVEDATTQIILPPCKSPNSSSTLTTADYLQQRAQGVKHKSSLRVSSRSMGCMPSPLIIKGQLQHGTSASKKKMDTVSLFTSTSSGSLSVDGDTVTTGNPENDNETVSFSSYGGSAFSFSKLRSSTSGGDSTPRRKNNSDDSTYISSRKKTEMSWTAREKKINRLRANNRRLLETTSQRFGILQKDWNKVMEENSAVTDYSSIGDTTAGTEVGEDGSESNHTASTAATSATTSVHSTTAAENDASFSATNSASMSTKTRDLLELTRSKTRIRQMEKELKRVNLANERLEVR